MLKWCISVITQECHYLFISKSEVQQSLIKIKGIFCDSNNIFLWYESENIIKKAYFQNFSSFQFYVFKLCMILCISLLPYITVLNKVFCENCSHFILKWFQPNLCGEVCFLEECTTKMQKIHILKFWEHPLSDISEYAFNLIRINQINFKKKYIWKLKYIKTTLRVLDWARRLLKQGFWKGVA